MASSMRLSNIAVFQVDAETETDEHKLKRVLTCRAFLTCYHSEGEEFLACIVMGDQTWVDYYEPESKRQSMEW
jgi:hypothetical protein